jgi:predicted GIY-YIG superfamily endonuclease
MRYVYLIKNTETNTYKIGISVNPKKRLKTLQTGSSGKLIIVELYESEFFFKIESTLHRQYAANRLIGEWFLLGDTEVDNFINDCKSLESNFSYLANSNNPFI